MRGEHCADIWCLLALGGSSPHARGALRLARYPRKQVRIIPACAGSTARARGRPWPARDHPRMRGEHSVSLSFQASIMGSSPHARGAPGDLVPHTLEAGIIPACAGSTRRGPRHRSWTRDHPRMRGEHFWPSVRFLKIAGSSPHARGAPLYHVAVLLRVGIIPACAGSTCRPPTGSPCPWDHPRMRGEHWAIASVACWATGSSPHARGAPVVRRTHGRVFGIIPACAGSTDPCAIE